MRITNRSLISSLVLTVLLVVGVSFVFGQFLIASDGKFRYDAHQRRDPFMSLVTASLYQKQKLPSFSLERIKLEGLVVDPLQGSFVMIDGEFYQEGDMLGPYQIENITESYVLFTFEDQSYKVNLAE